MNLKRKIVAVFFSFVILSSGTGLYQSAHAEESWSSILKPLVSSVVMPVVNRGLDTVKTKLAPKKVKQSTHSIFVKAPVEVLSSAETSISEMSWKPPEEPSH